MCLRENASSEWSSGRTPVQGLLDLSELVRKPRTDVVGYSQPSLAGLFLALVYPRTYVLGYFQPSPSTSSGQALRDCFIAGSERSG
jgi:hypothetical protein